MHPLIEFFSSIVLKFEFSRRSTKHIWLESLWGSEIHLVLEAIVYGLRKFL